jgi:hypothetical protein
MVTACGKKIADELPSPKKFGLMYKRKKNKEGKEVDMSTKYDKDGKYKGVDGDKSEDPNEAVEKLEEDTNFNRFIGPVFKRPFKRESKGRKYDAWYKKGEGHPDKKLIEDIAKKRPAKPV